MWGLRGPTIPTQISRLDSLILKKGWISLDQVKDMLYSGLDKLFFIVDFLIEAIVVSDELVGHEW